MIQERSAPLYDLVYEDGLQKSVQGNIGRNEIVRRSQTASRARTQKGKPSPLQSVIMSEPLDGSETMSSDDEGYEQPGTKLEQWIRDSTTSWIHIPKNNVRSISLNFTPDKFTSAKLLYFLSFHSC